MSEKLRRAVAIIALIFMSLFTVLLIVYIFDKDKTLLNGAVGELTIWVGAIGLLLTLVLWITRSFPSQQVKDEEREKLYKEAEKAEEETLQKEEDELSSESDEANDTDKS